MREIGPSEQEKPHVRAFLAGRLCSLEREAFVLPTPLGQLWQAWIS
jgi:hypothetical protein